MENFKFQTIMLQILNINLDISNKVFSTIKFYDEKLEQMYLQDEKEKSAFNNLLTDSMIIVGYITSLSYIILASYQETMLIMTILSLVGSTILIILSNISKDQKLIKIFSHLKIFLININLNLKAIIMSVVYNTKENDNSEEIMRVIIYEYFSTNLFILVKLESHLINYVFYFLLNLVTVVFAEKYSNVSHYYYLDALTGFILFFIFYFLRRQWDLKSRKLFSEKYKFEKLFQYSIDFINGLNGYHINLKNNNIIFMDNRFKELYNELDYKNAYKLNEIFTYNPLKVPQVLEASNNLMEINNSNNINNNNKGLALNSKYEYFKIHNNSALINSNNLSLKNGDMPNNLLQLNEKFNKNQNLINLGVFNDSKILSKQDTMTINKENEIKFNLFLDSLIYFEGKKFNILYDNLFNENISLFGENEKINIDETINTYTDYSNPDKKVNYFKNFVSSNVNKKPKDKKDLLSIDKTNNINRIRNENNSRVKSKTDDNNNNFNTNNQIFDLDKLNNDAAGEEHNNQNFKSNKIIEGDFEIHKKKSLLEELKYIQSSQIIIQEKFSHLGIYYFNESSNQANNSNNKSEDDSSEEEGKKQINEQLIKSTTAKDKATNNILKKANNHRQYFEVYLRRIKLNEQDDLICDIIFYDVSELVSTRLRIYEESITKQKIITKIANDFKTPLNSIIGIVSSLNFEFDNLKEKFNSLKKIEQSVQAFDKLPNVNLNVNAEIQFLVKEIQKFDLEFLNVYKNNLNFIGNLSNYLNILTNDIIHYKNNFNDITVYKNLISVKELIVFCSEILKILLNCKSKTKRINIYLNLDEEINQMFIYTDETRIKQIMLNFISNSVKFTKFGFISIDCKKIENTDKLKISIDDSGQGIKEEFKKKIFTDTNIFNLDSNPNENDDDLNSLPAYNLENGSGLHISKTLAKKLDCEIGFFSELSKGSSFFLKVPFMLKNDANKNKQSLVAFENVNQNISFKKQISNMQVDGIKGDFDCNHNNNNINLNNVNKDEKNDFLKTEEPNDKKPYKDVKEVSSNLNDFDCSKIMKKNEKIYNLKATLLLDNTTNFFDEMKNLNPYHSFISIANEIGNKAILKDFYPNDTERKSEKRCNEFIINNLVEEVSQKTIKPTKKVSLKNPNIRKNEDMMFNHLSSKLEERIETIKEVSIENYNDMSFFSKGGGITQIDLKLKTNDLDSNKNAKMNSFMNSISVNLKSVPKIILVQENQLEKQATKSILESLLSENQSLCNLKTLSDGEELIDEINQDRREGCKIKCIIIDENIKRLSGSEVIKLIREMEKEGKIKNIKIITMISYDDKNYVQKIIEAGADFVLKKPVSKENVFNSFRKLNLI